MTNENSSCDPAMSSFYSKLGLMSVCGSIIGPNIFKIINRIHYIGIQHSNCMCSRLLCDLNHSREQVIWNIFLS